MPARTPSTTLVTRAYIQESASDEAEQSQMTFGVLTLARSFGAESVLRVTAGSAVFAYDQEEMRMSMRRW